MDKRNIGVFVALSVMVGAVDDATAKVTPIEDYGGFELRGINNGNTDGDGGGGSGSSCE